MKVLLFILFCSFAYGQPDSVSEWETVRVLIGCADTTWRIGNFHPNGSTGTEEIQFRSNGVIVQVRYRYKKPE